MKTFEDFGLVVQEDNMVDENLYLSTCPRCIDINDDPKEQLSVSIYKDDGRWLCHNCGWRGEINVGDSINQSWLFKDPVLPVYQPKKMTKSTENWFSKRSISELTIQKYSIGVAKFWSSEKHRIMEAVAIPYMRDNLLINVNYKFGKSGGRTFEAGAEIIPFGLDDLDEETTFICSSEVDKLVLYEAGEKRAISLPFNIPNSLNNKNNADNVKIIHENLSFLDSHEGRFSKVKKFVLCLGGKKSSKIFEEELGRRLGREKCWIAQWPSDAPTIELLIKTGGIERVKQLLAEIKPYPVKGVFEISDVQDKFNELYETGLPPGPITGWSSLDDYYRPALGQWTLVTGIPSHGKSNWLDALMCQLADIHGWNFCLFSPENQPIARHFANLAEKYIGSSFKANAKDAKHMTIEEKEKAQKWLSRHFTVVLPDDDDGNWTIEGILDLARSVILRKGVKGIVIDPWNELDHSRNNGLSETEHVSRVISKIRQFARTHSVHVWLVAHPTKMYKDEHGIYPVPTPYDVAGSAHFQNKADFCISVYRFVGQPDQTITDLYIQKIRFKENGKLGRVSLRYTPTVGCFVDDIDQVKRTLALNMKQSKPTEEFIKNGTQNNSVLDELPEF